MNKVFFSYGQLIVRDASPDVRIGRWAEAHFCQGFARASSLVSFRTLFDWGQAPVSVYLEPYVKNSRYVRAIRVPFKSVSGIVAIHAPDDWPPIHKFSLERGHYGLTCAQEISGEEEETISLFFERVREPLLRSAILVCDAALDPPEPLIEGLPEFES